MNSLELVQFAAKLLDSKKAKDIAALEVKAVTSLADYFLVASGSSTTQVKALADELEDKLAAQGTEPARIESTAVWVLLDYRDVIVHIFTEETRDFYCLERLYADAPKLSNEQLTINN
jgi:ribosome-associated protein